MNTINEDTNVLVIGAGPCGLGVAYRLKELGHKNFTIIERHPYVGGLSASFEDENGFWWDIGGHVLFSHYKYFDKLVDKMLDQKYLKHNREAWIWMMNRFVPYPFQNNIKYLPKKILLECILELIKAQKKVLETKDFKEWIYQVFGTGIAKYFIIPYNFKVWAHPAELMDKSWIAERVSVIDVERILKNVIYDKDDVSWGPNNQFLFPLRGGTGEIFRGFVPYIKDNLNLNTNIISINTKEKKVKLENGNSLEYDILINTMPLDQLVKMSDLDHLKKNASGLDHNSGVMVGVGLKGELPANFKTKCWNYFPEDDNPFYRVTIFSNYSPNHVKKGHWSLLTETSYSPHKKIDKEKIKEEVIKGLINTKFIKKNDNIASVWVHDVDYSYPVPTLTRDPTLKAIQPELMKRDIYSRGRFGAWKYEVANMDHSVMQGVEIVNKLLKGEKETIWTL